MRLFFQLQGMILLPHLAVIPDAACRQSFYLQKTTQTGAPTLAVWPVADS